MNMNIFSPHIVVGVYKFLHLNPYEVKIYDGDNLLNVLAKVCFNLAFMGYLQWWHCNGTAPLLASRLKPFYYLI